MQNDWAVIFDWDGVVIDSSAAHEVSWEQLASEEGRSLPHDHFERGFGLRGDSIIREILGWPADDATLRRLIGRKEELYRAEIRRTGLTLLPGIAAFLEALDDGRIPYGVGSSTPRGNIDCAMEMLGLEGRFRAVVAAGDVTRGKPEPDVFLEAARRLGLPAHRCVVVEDAPAGIEAAHRGGMLAVGLSTTHPAHRLSAADWVVQRLDEIGIDALRNHLESRGAGAIG